MSPFSHPFKQVPHSNMGHFQTYVFQLELAVSLRNGDSQILRVHMRCLGDSQNAMSGCHSPRDPDSVSYEVGLKPVIGSPLRKADLKITSGDKKHIENLESMINFILDWSSFTSPITLSKTSEYSKYPVFIYPSHHRIALLFNLFCVISGQCRG